MVTLYNVLPYKKCCRYNFRSIVLQYMVPSNKFAALTQRNEPGKCERALSPVITLANVTIAHRGPQEMHKSVRC